jgi:hypothetical protein
MSADSTAERMLLRYGSISKAIDVALDYRVKYDIKEHGWRYWDEVIDKLRERRDNYAHN